MPLFLLYYGVAIVASYFVGSISFAVISSKLFHLEDPRHFGSGNPGATNVLRSGNKKAALFTLVGDALKGWAAVCLTLYLLPYCAAGIALVAMAVFLGHVYSIFLGFKGGKGVATSIGIMLALHPLLAFILIALWVLVFFLFRYSSLAALVSACSAPILYLIITLQDYSFQWWIFISILTMAALLVYNHRRNLDKLLKGTESKFGKR